jgi:hypothetical protein
LLLDKRGRVGAQPSVEIALNEKLACVTSRIKPKSTLLSEWLELRGFGSLHHVLPEHRYVNAFGTSTRTLSTMTCPLEQTTPAL